VFLRLQREYDRLMLQWTYQDFSLQRIGLLFDLPRLHERLKPQRLFKRFNIIIGFSVLLVLLAANTVIMRHLLDVQSKDQAWLSHSQQVLTQVAQIQSLLANAEIGERGYIYTHDSRFLGPYDLAVAELDPNLRQLEQLTADNPREQARIVKLRSLVQAKIEMLSTTIVLLQSGYPGYANESVVSERGRLLLVDIDNLMSDIAREENSHNGSLAATYLSSRGRTAASIYIASSAVALGLIFLAYHILKEVRLRERRARERLAREKLFRSVLTSLGNAVIATDTQGIVTFLNPKAERLMGIRLSHAKGQPVEKVFPLFDTTTLEPLESFASKLTASSSPDDIEHEALLRGHDGKLMPITNNATSIRDRQDKLIGAVLTFRDLTHVRRERELLSEGRSAVSPMILAAASRHIDAPLVAVGDLIYIAKLDVGISADGSKILTQAEGHLGRASHISREILGFYHQSELFEQLDMSVLTDSVLKNFSSKFASKHITVVRDFSLCPCVSGVSGDLNQAISNLVSNAVDAVPFGGTIRAQLSCSTEADVRSLKLSIRDSGPGIGSADRFRLFEPFFTTKGGSGYGLGLWVSKGIVERHGGSMQVEYEDANGITGTAFNVILPVGI
jgi:PAS domain S-box-containing protein